MNGLFYSSKRTVRNLHQIDLEASLTLKEINGDSFNRKNFLIALTNALKEILEQRDINVLIEKVFALEGDISRIKRESPDNLIVDDLSEFYKALSPILLRVVWETTSFVNNVDEFVDKIVESLRVSLEEELFYWQEELKSIDK